jgi:AcrR family transcriptional regulator
MPGHASSAARRRPSARRGEGERLREEILQTTTRLIEESGDVASLSLRQVAHEVGVAATSIYLHFASLDELVRTVKDQGFAELIRALEDAAADVGEDEYARVRAFAHAYVDFGMTHPGLYYVWFSGEMLPPPPESKEGYIGESAFALVRDHLAAIVGDDRAHVLAVNFWCGLHGLVTLRSRRKAFPWPDLDVQIDDFVDRLLPPR